MRRDAPGIATARHAITGEGIFTLMTDHSATSDASPWPLDRHAYPLRLREYLPSTKQALNTAVRRVLRIATSCGCPEENQTDLEIALREALANAIIHGNAFHDAKSIFLRCYGAPGSAMLIIVRDQGEGFAPGEVPDPRGPDRMHLHHGRGLFLMRELMDYVEHRKNGREVILYKTLVCGDGNGAEEGA
jgi:serine/threonine-protein kinase RsbW